MKKRVPFTEQDEDAIDSVFHWRRKYNEAVDKWIRLDSLLLRIMRENDEKDRQIAFLKDAHDAKCGECGKSAAEGWALYCVSCCEDSMVKAAVAEEREACAQICYARCPMDGTVSVEVELARAIRARGEA